MGRRQLGAWGTPSFSLYLVLSYLFHNQVSWLTMANTSGIYNGWVSRKTSLLWGRHLHPPIFPFHPAIRASSQDGPGWEWDLCQLVLQQPSPQPGRASTSQLPLAVVLTRSLPRFAKLKSVAILYSSLPCTGLWRFNPRASAHAFAWSTIVLIHGSSKWDI